MSRGLGSVLDTTCSQTDRRSREKLHELCAIILYRSLSVMNVTIDHSDVPAVGRVLYTLYDNVVKRGTSAMTVTVRPSASLTYS